VLALLYDIHGNLPALDAVLADARVAGADRFLLGGDYTLFGAWPLETLERLDALNAEWLRGNGERWTANPAGAPFREPLRSALIACRELLPQERIAQLGELPVQLSHDGTLFCHASPGSDVIGFNPGAAADERTRLGHLEARRVVAGHTHVQFHRPSTIAGIELVNPGSVGLPLDGDRRAAYALIDDDDVVHLRRVGYDVDASARAVRQRFGPWAETVARRLEHAELVLAPPSSRLPQTQEI
jgi:diadenosine tetraphosphatase ApaH/serine/threonine PP2A family protein phosphatase